MHDMIIRIIEAYMDIEGERGRMDAFMERGMEGEWQRRANGGRDGRTEAGRDRWREGGTEE